MTTYRSTVDTSGRITWQGHANGLHWMATGRLIWHGTPECECDDSLPCARLCHFSSGLATGKV